MPIITKVISKGVRGNTDGKWTSPMNHVTPRCTTLHPPVTPPMKVVLDLATSGLMSIPEGDTVDVPRLRDGVVFTSVAVGFVYEGPQHWSPGPSRCRVEIVCTLLPNQLVDF